MVDDDAKAIIGDYLQFMIKMCNNDLNQVSKILEDAWIVIQNDPPSVKERWIYVKSLFNKLQVLN